MGLVPKPKRSVANYRLYSTDAVKRVQFIKKAQAIGLTLEEIKDILDVKDHGKRPAAASLRWPRNVWNRSTRSWRGFVFFVGRSCCSPQWQHDTAVERACAGEFCDLIERLP